MNSATSGVPRARVLLVDPQAGARTALAARLGSLGYRVETASDGDEAVAVVHRHLPDVVIADTWLPGVSGVQLCRRLHAEAATSHVPVVLRGDDDREHRFWAERAGAFAFVMKGRVADLVGALERAIGGAAAELEAWRVEPTQTEPSARHLDAELFASVVRTGVHALARCATWPELFDRLSQLVSQVHPHRWLALEVPTSGFFGLHHHVAHGVGARAEAHAALGAAAAEPAILADEDAVGELDGPTPLVVLVTFGGVVPGVLGLAPSRARGEAADTLLRVLARELRVARDLALLTPDAAACAPSHADPPPRRRATAAA